VPLGLPIDVPRPHHSRRAWTLRSTLTLDDEEEDDDDDDDKRRKRNQGAGKSSGGQGYQDMPRIKLKLAEVAAWAMGGGKTKVALPEEWKYNIMEGTLQQVWAKGTEAGEVRMFDAQCKHDPSFKFSVKEMPRSSRRALHEMYIGETMDVRRKAGMCRSGGFLAYYGFEAMDKRAFVMHEIADTNLADEIINRFPTVKWPGFDEKLSEQEQNMMKGQTMVAWSPQKPMAVPLSYSLPILVDILRGLRDLESAGITVGDLTANRILLVDGGRAVIGSLDDSCTQKSITGRFNCAALKDSANLGSFACSAVMSAPEVRDGSPTGPSNHVWGVGLLFARMCMGYSPTLVTVLEETEAAFAAAAMDLEPRGREQLRDIVRKKFAIEKDATFPYFDEDVQRLLKGMLAVAPADRLSTDMALELVMAVAADRGVEIKPPRQSPMLPRSWVKDGQAGASDVMGGSFSPSAPLTPPPRTVWDEDLPSSGVIGADGAWE